MTKIKKRLALLMALVMAMTMLALPASAAEAEDEAISPQAVVGQCPNCGGTGTTTDDFVRTEVWQEGSCRPDSNTTVHVHTYYIYDRYIYCRTCGRIYMYTWSNRVCNTIN